MFKIFISVFIFFIIISCKKSVDSSTNDVPKTDTQLTQAVPAQILYNVKYGTDSLQNMDVYLPSNRTVNSTKVLVMIHGGGWSEGDKAELIPFVDSMQRRLPDYAMININYRLALGSNLFPAQENDVNAAIQFIAGKSSEYLISKKIVLLGVSAGGHLALLQGYKYTMPVKVKAIVSFFGPTNLTDMYKNPANPYVQAALIDVIGKSFLQDSLIYNNSSPVNFVNSNSAPTILLHGETDYLVPYSQSISLHSTLDSYNVTNQLVLYPTEGHGWEGANLTDSFNKIDAFLKANVN